MMRANRAPRLRVVASAAALGLLLGAGTGGAASAAPGDPGRGRFIPGAEGIGDPYFPLAGNGGIDVLHYDLDLDYTPPADPEVLEGELAGTATLRIRATDDLRSFNLDLRGLDATGVTVDGKPARQTQRDGELRITPRPKLRSGETVDVVITYGGTTTRPRDIEDALYGWVTTADGAMVVSEPDGASTWFPVNDHPSDKASYAFEITVPDGLVAVANGDLVGSSTEDERTTWTWDAPAPMAAYLATATVGNFELQESTAPDGTPILDAVDADLDPSRYADLALTGEMMAYFTSEFGAYPFGSYGAIVDDDSVGYALETQTRSFFSRSAREGTVAHELAHQWYGDSVSPERWADIWLNEGWAVYATWMWFDHRGEQSVQEAYEEVLAIPADDPFWDVVVSDPGPTSLFAGAIYDRGAATLQALRLEIGDEAFSTVAQEWVARYGGGSASTDDFRALAEEVSGQDLDALFEAWLDTPAKPSAQR